MTSVDRTAAVVGAGLAGLSAAHQLRKSGWAVTVFEASDRPGGRVQTVERDGYLMDTGASAIADSYTAYLALINELGLDKEIVFAARSVGIYREGHLHELPLDRPLKMATTSLLSWTAKLRASRLIFDIAVARMRGQLDYADLFKAAPLDTETAASYADRALGRELRDYFVSTITRVMLIADPEKISKVELFSGVANILAARIACLRGGQGRLPELLAHEMAPRYRHVVQHVALRDGGVDLQFEDDSGTRSVETFDACVMACPLPDAASICPEQALLVPLMKALTYTQCVTVALAFKTRPDCASFLVQMPTCEDPDVALMFLDHNKSSDRAPPGKALIDCHWETDAASSVIDEPDECIIDRSMKTVLRVFPELQGQLEFGHVTRWKHALPWTRVGSYRLIADFNAGLDPTSPIQYASDYMSSAGQNSVIALGRRAAENIVKTRA